MKAKPDVTLDALVVEVQNVHDISVHRSRVCRFLHWRSKATRRCRFRWMNAAPLNDTLLDLGVNILKCRHTNGTGKGAMFSWITDFEI